MPSANNRSELRNSVVLGQWTRLLFEALARGGVVDAVISPGSRNTPLIAAALAHPSIKCHSVIDERGAAFFALGLSRCTKKPTLLICTSGSAAGHYLPALIEASLSEQPLLVLTADRPTELQDCGAPQTLRQEGMLGNFARSAAPIGEPSPEPDKLFALYRKALQAVHMTASPTTAPVHINFPVAKPLSPEAPQTQAELALQSRVSDILSEGSSPFASSSLTSAEDELAQLVSSIQKTAKKCLITVGPLPWAVTKQIRQLAESLAMPCLVELPQAGPSAPLDFLAASLRLNDNLRPERILHFGPPCVSAAWNEYLKESSHELSCLPGELHRDPSQRAQRVLLERLETLVPRLLRHVGSAALTGSATLAAERLSYSSLLEDECRRITRTMSALLPTPSTIQSSANAAPLPELLTVAQILKTLPDEIDVIISNSLTLRLASWMSSTFSNTSVHFHTSRGANGIDGWLATAAGVAAASRRPTIAIVGDVSAAHDLSSLALVRGVNSPLLIALLDNGGGQIFSHLPLGNKAQEHAQDWAFWSTPPKVNWEAAAATYGITYRSCRSEEAISRAVQKGLASSSATLLHLPTDSLSTHHFIRSLEEEVAQLR